jgi:hypothetical protein
MIQFIKDLDALHTSHAFQLDHNRKVPVLTEEEEEKYRNSKKCENCGAEFGSKRENGDPVVKVKHHDHVTNMFIGAWCSLCNIRNNNRYFKTIVYLHNFSGYDGHFILKYAVKYMHEYSPWSYNTQKIISKSSQKIKHFQYSKFIFIDSLNHLNSSLDSLVEILNKSNHESEIFNRLYLHPFLRSKGISPYKWVDSVEKLKETSLPSIEWFDNDLTGEKCTEDRYNILASWAFSINSQHPREYSPIHGILIFNINLPGHVSPVF